MTRGAEGTEKKKRTLRVFGAKGKQHRGQYGIRSTNKATPSTKNRIRGIPTAIKFNSSNDESILFGQLKSSAGSLFRSARLAPLAQPGSSSASEPPVARDMCSTDVDIAVVERMRHSP